MSEDQEEHFGASNLSIFDLLSVMAFAPGGDNDGIINGIVTISGDSVNVFAGIVFRTG